VTGWTTPDQDTMDRIVFHLQCPDWTITSPASSDKPDGRGTPPTAPLICSAASLDALMDELMDELDWRHAT